MHGLRWCASVYTCEELRAPVSMWSTALLVRAAVRGEAERVWTDARGTCMCNLGFVWMEFSLLYLLRRDIWPSKNLPHCCLCWAVPYRPTRLLVPTSRPKEEPTVNDRQINGFNGWGVYMSGKVLEPHPTLCVMNGRQDPGSSLFSRWGGGGVGQLPVMGELMSSWFISYQGNWWAALITD